ncbi:MAG: hypothetical protein LBN06_06890 [Prevotellaceae bacterium]|jgi:hypothetical protein|nr:hypothetical protein [Prevotellaceae bacterium]
MKVAIEKQKDGTYIAYNVEGEGVIIGTGNSVSEAKDDYMNSVEEVRAICIADGDNLPDTVTAKPQFKFDLSSLFEYYSMLNVSAFAKFVGISSSLMRQYKQGNTYISEKQLEKIQAGIHRLGKEFSALTLV